MSPFDLLRARAAARSALRNLVGALLITAAFGIGFLDVKADGDVKLTTWLGCSVIASFGGWLIDHQLLERFIAWAGKQLRVITGAIAAAKQPPASGGAT